MDGCLWALSAKYFDEKVEHGAVNFDQSLSIMQSASNCQKFLIKLREEKVKTEAQKCLSETFSQRKDQQDI